MKIRKLQKDFPAILSLSLLLGGVQACTTISPEDDKAPCNDIGQCLPGWICQNGQCAQGSSGNGEANLIPHIIQAVKSHATLGEISDTLRSTFGEY